MNINKLKTMRQQGEKISMVTCYSHWAAKLVSQSQIDCVLVGDSVAMVVHGHPNTISATLDMMATHTEAVARGLTKKLLITDMPFLAHKRGLTKAVDAACLLMQKGAHGIKIEGAGQNLELISHLVEGGVPIMGHLGLTLQSIHQLGGPKVQGRSPKKAQQLLEDARNLEEAGCFALVLECIPPNLARTITEALSIPTIGIGAGPFTSGQVLVTHDLLGLNPGFQPKFLKTYAPGATLVTSSLDTYHQEVRQKTFPESKHCYGD